MVQQVSTPVPKRRRLPPQVRREQLLESAVLVLVERGFAGVTMDAVAGQAGVDKALVYRHFGNARAVVAELYTRYLTRLGERVLQAVTTSHVREERLRAAVSAFLDVVEEHRQVLPVLMRPEVREAIEDVEQGVQSRQFFLTLLVGSFGVPHDRADVAVEILLGILTGGAAACELHPDRRAVVEPMVLDACAAALGWAPISTSS